MYFIPFLLVYLLLNLCLFMSIACLYSHVPLPLFWQLTRVFSRTWTVIHHYSFHYVYLCTDGFIQALQILFLLWHIKKLSTALYICFRTYEVLLISSYISTYKEKVVDLIKICLWNEGKAEKQKAAMGWDYWQLKALSGLIRPLMTYCL